MLRTLTPEQLTSKIDPAELGFADTSELLQKQAQAMGWIGQAEAEKAARFGLALQQPGFNLMVLGERGCGRTSLMLATMKEMAAIRQSSPDLGLVHQFDFPDKPLPLYISAGKGAELRVAFDHYIRFLARTIPLLLNEHFSQANLDEADKQIPASLRAQIAERMDMQLNTLAEQGKQLVLDAGLYAKHLQQLRQDTLDNLEVFIPNPDAENLLENFLGRYRLNLMVDNRGLQGAPVIYDDDPSFQSLFGGYEGSADTGNNGMDFLRLRAGNLLRAHGGMLMLHLRDIQADQQNGSQILEKLYRVLRNRSIQIEESSGSSSQNSTSHFSPEALPLEVKVVLITDSQDFYLLQDEMPDFADLFPIKVDFVERFPATPDSYRMLSIFTAIQCDRMRLPHVEASAVAMLIAEMKRKIEDQTRISANFKYLQRLLMEAAAYAAMRQGNLISEEDVLSVLTAKYNRHSSPERQLADAVVDGEVLLTVHGRQVGQINGLTHIDLGDTGFGSPVRITARCSAGNQGVINIDREVEMTGPNHDKGLFILRSWLASSFVHLTPLSLNASIVFEQEYQGVEGDSASCAELYALLSALSDLGLSQGVAVTGALNQFGEVMPIGGVNEKIEGYFRICKRLGLDGSQGVIIPSRNMAHLMLADEVVKAVADGLFNIYAVDHVLEGMAILTGVAVDAVGDDGFYQSSSVMGRVQQALEQFRKLHESNRIAHRMN